MAKRKSKYEMLVGTEVNGVLVSNYRKQKRTSKSGNSYFKYEVELEGVLWVSTQSFNKGSYTKRLEKALGGSKRGSKGKEVDEQGSRPKAPKTSKKAFKGYWYYQNRWYSKSEFNKLMKDDVAWKHWCMMLHMSNASYIAKKRAEQSLERLARMFDMSDNMNVYGQKMFDSPQAYYERWMRFEVELFDSEAELEYKRHYNNLPQDLEQAFKEALRIAFVEEFGRAFKAYVTNHWHELEERYKKAWNERYGEQWKRQWERTSFNSRVKGSNEYDAQFKGLDLRGIKKLHRTLSKHLHPDMPTGNEEQFVMMQEAYERAMSRVA